MPKGIIVGTLTGNGSLFVNVQPLFATRFTLIVSGTVNGSLVVKGGTATVREDVMVTSPSAGQTHNNFPIGLVGAYTFEAICEELEFALTGSTSPDMDLVLYPEARQ